MPCFSYMYMYFISCVHFLQARLTSCKASIMWLLLRYVDLPLTQGQCGLIFYTMICTSEIRTCMDDANYLEIIILLP